MSKSTHTSLIIALAMTAAACDSDAPAVDAPEPDRPEAVLPQDSAPGAEPNEEVELHYIWGDWDPDDDLEALQGHWVTTWGPDDEVQTRWQIDGDQAIHHRHADDDDPQQGTVAIDYPGALILTVQGDDWQTSTIAAFAREGDHLYLGLGMGGVVSTDRLVLRHGRDLLVYHDDGRCLQYSPTLFDGFDAEGTAADCEIVEENDQAFFTFTNPDTGRAIGLEQRILIGDQSLADSQLRGHQLQPVP